MSSKQQLTQSLVTQLDQCTFEEAMATWWQNPDGGWRLTPVGFKAFEQLELEHWDFEMPTGIQTIPAVLLTLDRKLTGPYYIQLGKKSLLCFFNSKEATMYGIYGDIKKFVDSLFRY